MGWEVYHTHWGVGEILRLYVENVPFQAESWGENSEHDKTWFETEKSRIAWSSFSDSGKLIYRSSEESDTRVQSTQEQLNERLADMGIEPMRNGLGPKAMKVAEDILPPKTVPVGGARSKEPPPPTPEGQFCVVFLVGQRRESRIGSETGVWQS